MGEKSKDRERIGKKFQEAERGKLNYLVPIASRAILINSYQIAHLHINPSLSSFHSHQDMRFIIL